MSAGDYDIIVEQGATFTRTITVQDDGVARNLTGYTIRMQARKSHDATTTYLDIDTTSGEIVITDAANGIFTITLTAAVQSMTALEAFLAANTNEHYKRLYELKR